MSNRRAFLGSSLALALSMAMAANSPAHAQATTPLKLAVHPYASTLALINTHRPLQQYLEKALQRPVEFFTAPNFDSFVTSLMAGEYDIALCPPHFAVLAAEKDYAPLFHFQTRLEPLLAVRKDSRLRSAADMRGKRIAMADRTAFIRIVMVRWLADNGLKAAEDYQIYERPTHVGSITAVAMGEADAGLTTTTALKQVAPDVQAQLFTISSGLKFPHLFTLAHRRLGDAGIDKLRTVLRAFGSAPEGREFFEKTGYGGFEPIADDEIRLLRPYADLYRQMSGAR